MKQALKKIRFCKDYYYEMDDHTLKYHVLTIWKFSSREQSGWGYIQSYGGLKNATRKKKHIEFHGFRKSSLNPMDLETI